MSIAASGAVKVEKLTLVADAGTIVDPDGARAQMEGASLWGLSLALHEGTAFENGNVKDTNLDSYTPLRLADVPELDITFVDSAEVPVGLGEPATTDRRPSDRQRDLQRGRRAAAPHPDHAGRREGGAGVNTIM